MAERLLASAAFCVSNQYFMKKIILLILAALTFSGCGAPTVPSVSRKESSVNQIFEQKKQCEPYYQAYKKEKESETDHPITGLEYPIVDARVCFSKKFNSCVGYSYSLFSYRVVYELKDLLTGKILAFNSYPTNPSSPRDPAFAERNEKFTDDVTNVDCSDGQILDIQ